MTDPVVDPDPDPAALARTRVVVGAAVGAVVCGALTLLTPWQVSVMSGWDAMALVIVVWVGVAIWPMDGSATARYATREDDSRATADILLVSASVASLVGVAFVLVKASQQHGPPEAATTGVAVVSVVLSWLLVHAVYILRYAHLYYLEGGGIDFNDDSDPDYRDFAYVALTVGMTYQLSDTNVSSKLLRRAVTRHALLSYLFGTAVIALMINVVAGLLHP